jgi:hypothetical protein
MATKSVAFVICENKGRCFLPLAKNVKDLSFTHHKGKK